ncbi:hypothetical protein BC938DRAFT_474901 [Jimgerdemannia flammicorona]|uniref:RRM domain-containing protein n=1 Tax=Jimgerdemannia flammicorona TaxID=994334 RepID=A0A433Q1A6_9FUNG|nr:hypothetical protein BC938DRAFT_474901 [Jimgerdemannia flammicorona]
MSYDEETSKAQQHNDTTPSATSISSSSTVATTPSDTTGPTVDSLLDRQTKSDPEPSHDSTINASEGGIEPGVPEGREKNADPLEDGEQRAQENKHDYAVGALADAVEGLHVASDTESVGGIDSVVSTSGSSSSVAASSLSAPTNPSRSPAHQHHPKHSHNNNTGNHHQKRRDYVPQRHSPMMVPYTPPSPYAYPTSLPPPQTYMPPSMIPTAPTGAYYPQYYVPPSPGGYYYDPSAAAAAGVSPASYLRPPHRPPLPNAIPTAYNMQPYGYSGIPTTPQGTPPIAPIPPPLPLQPGTTYSPMNPTTVAGAARSPRYPHSQLPLPVPTMPQPNFAGAPPVFYDPQPQMQYPSTHLTIYPRPPPSPSVLPVTIPPQSQLRPPSGPIPIPIPVAGVATGDPNMFAYPRPPHSPLQAPALSPGAPSPALPPRISGIRPILAPPGQQPPTLLAPFPTQSLSSQHPKPRNPDNAMWVGNLPSNTGPEDLRDFFWEEDFEVGSRGWLSEVCQW